MRAPSVGIVVLNWNAWQETLSCLASLDGLAYPAREVVVVDNGSTDGSIANIIGRRPDVPVLPAGRNLGFAGGCNLRSRQ